MEKTALASGGGGLPSWWPAPEQAGLPASLAGTHVLLPVHPLTAREALDGVSGAIVAPGATLRVRPTLSVETVAVTARPATHLKLPLPAGALGPRGRNGIEPATLPDGALVHRVLTDVLEGGTSELDGLLLADESAYAHAGHRYLGCLIRRMPAGLGECHVVPAAGLLAPYGEGGRLVIDHLADVSGRPVTELAGAWFDLVFSTGVRLLARYGIVLNSDRRNTALVLDPAGGGGLRMLVAGFAGARIGHGRLVAALGSGAPAQAEFRDEGMLTGSDEELVAAFIATTVHLCAGAVAFGLARAGRAPLADLLAMARGSLTAATDAEAASPVAHLLRSRTQIALRLPGPGGVTGPNYLRIPGGGW